MKKKRNRIQTGYDRHHKLARSRGGGNNAANISIVPIEHHRAYHRLFGRGVPHEIAHILTETWVDPNWEIIARKRE